MKVIFDSNVWQIVTIPEDYPNDPYLNDFKKIHKAIIDGKIEPYLSETIFTIEAIRKVERQDFFSSTKPKIDIKEKTVGNSISLNFTIGPNEEDAIDFNERPILKKYFDKAIELGFRIVSLPRIGGLVNKEIESVRFRLKGEELKNFLDRAFDVCRKIEEKGAGITQIKKIGKKYGTTSWFKGLKKAPESDRKKIAKAAAEWADGDSVAIAIALRCDYFCTRDEAKNAGSKSVLSQENLDWLKEEFGFRTIKPEELAKLL